MSKVRSKLAKKIAPPRAASRKRASSDRALRARLVELLRGGHAHAPFREVVRSFPPALRGRKPKGASHSAWQVLEHLRIDQWDILEFCRNPRHVSPRFPDGYWPAEAAPPSAGAWDRSIKAFLADLDAMVRLVANPRRELHAPVAHPEARAHHTLAREALLLADHNAYHLGELVLLRRLLGAWPPGMR